MKPLTIAIDGPYGAGKGTVAREVARRLGYTHVDTGAMYRGIAWLASARGLDLSDASAVAALAASAQFDLRDGVRVGGHDVTEAIRTPARGGGRGSTLQYPFTGAQIDYYLAAAPQGDIVIDL